MAGQYTVLLHICTQQIKRNQNKTQKVLMCNKKDLNKKNKENQKDHERKSVYLNINNKECV